MLRIFKVMIFLFSVFLAFELKANDAINIFEASREVPKSKIVGQNGREYSLKDFNGEFVVAVFWSKSCGPCIKELKGLNTFYLAALKEGIRLILISPKSNWKSTLEQSQFLKKYNAPDIEFYTDKKGNLAGDFGIFTTPHTVLIDENSQEIGRIRGAAKWGNPKVLDYIRQIKKDPHAKLK